MCRAKRTVVLATALAAATFSAKAQDGDIATVHAFAKEARKACHEVEAEEASPRMIEIGPAYDGRDRRVEARSFALVMTSPPPTIA